MVVKYSELALALLRFDVKLNFHLGEAMYTTFFSAKRKISVINIIESRFENFSFVYKTHMRVSHFEFLCLWSEMPSWFCFFLTLQPEIAWMLLFGSLLLKTLFYQRIESFETRAERIRIANTAKSSCFNSMKIFAHSQREVSRNPCYAIKCVLDKSCYSFIEDHWRS